MQDAFPVMRRTRSHEVSSRWSGYDALVERYSLFYVVLCWARKSHNSPRYALYINTVVIIGVVYQVVFDAIIGKYLF